MRGTITLAYISLASIVLGLVMMDVTYAWVLRGSLPAEQVREIFLEVSDSAPLMLMMGLAMLTGLAAVALNWSHPGARWLLAASAALLVLPGILVPMLMPEARTAAPGPAGSWLRIAMHLLVVVLAVAGSRLRHHQPAGRPGRRSGH